MGEAANGSPKRFIVKLIKRDPATARYGDLALTPVEDAEHLEMFEHSDAAKAAVAKAQAEAKAKSEKRVAAAE